MGLPLRAATESSEDRVTRSGGRRTASASICSVVTAQEKMMTSTSKRNTGTEMHSLEVPTTSFTSSPHVRRGTNDCGQEGDDYNGTGTYSPAAAVAITAGTPIAEQALMPTSLAFTTPVTQAGVHTAGLPRTIVHSFFSTLLSRASGRPRSLQLPIARARLATVRGGFCHHV